MVRFTTVAALSTAALPGTMAWGAMGHETVAYIASNYVSSATKSYFQGLLGDTSANYLASVAAWADSYRYTTAGRFSAPYHYIDANDNPPSTCGVNMDRDCGSEGCIVRALQNYTTILLDQKVSNANLQIAAKMVIHFAGDIGQPLHCEALEVGGNSIDVQYDGDDTNLHAIWDSNIPESISGGSSLSTAKSWATTLIKEIDSGDYKSQAAGWVSGLSVSSSANQVSTALKWATESNAYVCSTVLKGGVSAVENKDLSGDYTTTAQPVVDLQIAKQGYRLAKWLDAIVAAM
ncbi:nuclease S1 precursor [Annulohypoxylon maeteangense]|uniref:nuclease S1 precursor n=1 Tax=Annulohypoxylon maeteangense TaxID=1927788 RepID=UPI00200849C5|nr:nuclease S1 precursor [Annulohypoxylon maeteangense]KAI0888972.1 nuclease S1 precursor [Annulohypoxylon maeteangense]